MIVWLIGVGESLPTEGDGYRRWRTGMLAKALLERGHSIEWWTSSVDHFSKQQIVDRDERRAIAPDFHLRFLFAPLYSRNISIARLRNHRQLARRFTNTARTALKPDLIFTTFPPIELCSAVVRYGAENGVPTVIDVNDLWPDEMWARVPLFLRPLAKMVLSPMTRRVSKTMTGATSICAISNSYMRWALRLARRDQEAQDVIFPLGYPSGADRDIVSPWREGGKKRFLFVGTMARSIDLSTVIDAARLLYFRSDIRVVIVGAGEQENSLRNYARGLSNVEFTGWATQQEIAGHASDAYAGLAAYVPDALMSLPNKIFEYMRFGLPVLSCLRGEAEELLRVSGAGMSYRAGDARDLARKMTSLADDPSLRTSMSRAAREAFEERFSEEAIYPRLAEHLEQLAAAGRRSSSGFF